MWAIAFVKINKPHSSRNLFRAAKEIREHLQFQRQIAVFDNFELAEEFADGERQKGGEEKAEEHDPQNGQPHVAALRADHLKQHE